MQPRRRRIRPRFTLPSNDQVTSYARDAFAASEEEVGAIHEEEFGSRPSDFFDEGGDVIDHFGSHLTHASRHLGMIEALKGVLGVEGTATV